jgi:hypothetical protein
MRYIVELEKGVWISQGLGRTLIEDNAREYKRKSDAKGALTCVRKMYRNWARIMPFPHARIVEVEEVEG